MSIYPGFLNSLIARVESVPVGSGSRQGRGTRSIVLIFFFFSGASGLIYEVVWNRMLTLVFGATVFAVTTVLTVFMAGMALGSFYFGRFIDRRGNPLKVYACLQAGIAVFALLLPLILNGVEAIYIAIHQSLPTSFYKLSLIKFMLCFMALIVPTTLMGGTLPVLSKFFANRMERLGWSIGVLYAINTFGAVLGCFFAGFFLVRGIGVSGTIYLAIAINALIALGTLFLSRGSGSADIPSASEDSVTPEDADRMSSLPGWAGRVALLVVAVSGFCALAYEVLWARVLTLFLGSTTYAFTAMLTAFLCGIALGSILLARFIDARKDLLTMLGVVQIGIALSAILLIPVFGELYQIGGRLTRAGWLIFGRFALSFLIMLIPTLLMGATFPLVNKIYARSLKRLGRSIGNVYSVNTLGSILGSFSAGFILIPLIGIQRAIVIIAFLNATVGALVVIMNAVQFASRVNLMRRISLLIAAVIVIGIVSILIDLGQPLTRFTAIFKGQAGMKMLFYEEGVDASVTVVEDPEGVRRAFVDANQAAEDSRWDLPSHSIIGHLPILFHPEPESALVIGFGMGVTSWSISRHDVQVDAIEISPGMKKANKYFAKINNNVLSDPLVNLTIDDGRNYALTTDKKYDMISTGIIHPLVSANSAGFYTVDFYKICKRILTEDGIMCQWVPLHRVPEEHYKMIIRSFKKVFPHTTIWFKYTPDFSILIGTPEKLSIDFQDFKRRMENPAVKADLELVNMADPIALLDSFMMDEDTVVQYIGDGPLHTDNRPRMEFFGTQIVNTTHPNILGMKKLRKSVYPLLTNTGKTEAEVNNVKYALQQSFRATEYAISGQLFYIEGRFEDAIRQYNMASSINPQDDNVRWLADHVRGIMAQESVKEYRSIVKADPNSPTAHAGLGLAYREAGMVDEAIRELEVSLELDPGLAVALIYLGDIYQKNGMIDKAIEQFEKLLEVQPDSAASHGKLGEAYMEKGDLSQAEAEFKKALRLDPYMGLWDYRLAVLYLQQGDRLDDALASIQQAIKLSPESSPNFIATLARVYYEKGMYSDAEREIRRAIDLKSDNESYLALLAEIQKKQRGD